MCRLETTASFLIAHENGLSGRFDNDRPVHHHLKETVWEYSCTRTVSDQLGLKTTETVVC
jgi:hypothetical protein